MAASAGTFHIFQAGQLTGKLKFVGGNDIGPKVQMEFLSVSFTPANSAIGVIQDEFGQMQISAEVFADPTTGSFGTLTHPDTSLVSPLVALYYSGKGIVSIQLTSDVTYRDVGNVPVLEFQPNLTFIDHFQSRVGIRSKDFRFISEKTATLNLTLDEWSFANMQIALLGVVGP